MIKKLLLTVFLVLVQAVVYGATITSTATGGNWSATTTWVGGIVPGINDDVIIATGATVVINTDTTISINSLTVNGTLKTANNAITISVTNDVVVNIGGTLDLESNKDVFLKVFGDYYNNYNTDFWKAYVVVAGDFISSDTSTLQGNGRIAVGGDFIGLISISGGGPSGAGELWPVNPNATVSISPSSVGSGVVAGVLPTENILLGLINEVIYGGTCTFSLTTPSDVVMCSGAPTVSFTVTVSPISSPSFIWQVNTGGGWVDASDSTYYSGYQTNTLMVSNVTSSFNNYKYRVKVKQGTCTKNSNYGVLTVRPAPTVSAAGADQAKCNTTTFALAGNAPSIGTGLWTLVSGTASITTATLNTSGVTGVPVGTSATLRWTISNGSCAASTDEVILTNNATPTVAAAGADQANCNTTTFTLAGNAPTTGTGLWTLVSGTATITTPTSNISGVTGVTAGTSATFRWTISNGACTASTDEVVLINNAMPTTPIVSTTQPTCTLATGSITVTIQNSGETYSFDNGATFQASNIISSLSVGNYYVIIKSTGGCISSTTIVPITSPVKEWNGSISEDWNTAANWTPSGVPTSSNCVTIPSTARASIISGTNFVAYANTLTLQTSGRLTVNPSNTITVTDFVSAGSGFLVFENTASLVQINNVNSNSGYVDYKRSTTALQTDYTYWSSPVSPMTLGELYPLGSTFYSYEPTFSGEDWSPFGAGINMVAGKGYIANRGAAIPLPAPAPPPSVTPLDVIFSGIPNNGYYEINGIFANKSYLLGNPYPSALDAEIFLKDNADVLNGTLYFWTHKTPIGTNVSNPGTGIYAYSGNDYATYNATGGVAANQRDIDPATGQSYANPGGGGSAPNGSEVPSGKIASGQGFFGSSKLGIPANSKIIYNNTMRVGVIDISKEDNSQFFKTKSPNKSTKTIEKNRIWVNLTNTQGAFKQTLVGYITDATNDYDDRFDGESYDGNEFVDFYSVNQDKNLVIQGRALPFDENDEVPLGYRTTINGAFTMNIDQVDGFLTNQAVFIEDKLTNTVFDLKSGNYTFNTVEGTFNDRFVLRYTNTNKTLGTSNFDSLEKSVLVSNKNKQIKIDSAVEMIDKVTIFDVLGRQIYQKANVNSNELSISNLVSNRQMVMVKTTLQNGKTVTKKVIY